MRDRISVELRSDKNTRSFEALDRGPDLFCACTNHFVLLRDIPWPEMQAMVQRYADEHDAAMLEFFLQPASSVRKGSGEMNATQPLKIANKASPEALSIRMINTRSGSSFSQIAGWHCCMPKLNAAVAAHGLLEGYRRRKRTITPAWHIVRESYEIQRDVAKTMIGSSIRSMDWASPSNNLRFVASARVMELVEGCTSSEEFLSRVCAPLVHWFHDRVRKGFNGADTSDVARPLALAWFAAWLAERGVLLFPLNAVFGRSSEILPIRYRHFLDAWIRPAEKLEKCAVFYERMTPALVKSTRARDQSYLHLWTLNLSAPGLASGRVAAGCLKLIKESVRANDEESHLLSSIWKLEASRLKSSGFDPEELQTLTDQVIQRRLHVHDAKSELWAWIDDPNAKLRTWARYVRRDCKVGPNLKAHVLELRAIFGAIAGKSATKVSNNFSVWLFFLSSLRDELVPASLIGIQPRLLEGLRERSDKCTLRGFMVLEQIPELTQRSVFSTLKRAWKIVAQGAGDEGLLCPISDQMTSLRKRGVGERHSSSTRRAIDMDILEMLIEENRADDFSFSRQRAHSVKGKLLDYRLVEDPETGALVSTWWPGLATLMDVLLQIPLRHKQGRYLDSGEGDEFALDISSLQLQLNALPTAEKNRNQAFIQRISLSPLRDEPGLGMYINTNKTGTDYAFPWLLPDVAANVQAVIDWQKRYNPISAPVSDRDNNREERAANVDPILVYPIFRDPDRHNHKPVSSQIVLEYFRALLKHVERKYNLLNNTNIRFFRADGEPVYDIHALRVTGVTRLLSMGVDPKIVRLLVGHASLTMMFYYEHITNERITNAMERALELRRPNREALLAMSQVERERFLARLFNRSDQPMLAISLLNDLIDERSPFLDLRVDGICPGKRCSDAGVWRTRACSLCKYNITGVPFLAGLELVLNDLMAELVLNQKKVAELRDELYKRRREGHPIRALEAEIAKHDEFVDNVLQQWEAQFQYTKKAEADLVAWLAANPAWPDSDTSTAHPALLSPDVERMGVSLQETHHLALFTRLVEGAKRVEGFLPTVGARDARDAMLLEIVRHEHKTDLFYRLSPELRRLALDQFALLILDQDLPSEKISSLIDGSFKLSALQGAAAWLEQLGTTNSHLVIALDESIHD